jgi:hypothetical protein
VVGDAEVVVLGLVGEMIEDRDHPTGLDDACELRDQARREGDVLNGGSEEKEDRFPEPTAVESAACPPSSCASSLRARISPRP